MKFYGFSLLMLATVFIGKAYGCNFERISRSPRYDQIAQPKQTLSVPKPYGVCVASDGKFAVIPLHVNAFYLYYSCGKLMKIVRLPAEHRSSLIDCTFSGSDLYITGHSGKKLYKFTENGNFLKVIVGGEHLIHITSCQGRLYVTTERRNSRNVVSYYNDKETHRFNVPGRARGIVVGMDNNIYVSTFTNKVLSFTANGKLLGAKTYKEIRRGDGMAMDKDGNILIADHTVSSKLLVYSSCGELIKRIGAGFRLPLDVDIGNDGTVIVADHFGNKVYMY